MMQNRDPERIFLFTPNELHEICVYVCIMHTIYSNVLFIYDLFAVITGV